MNTIPTQSNAFMQGGGEMGERMRRYDWAKTALGSPQGWPQSLRTTISMLLNSRFAMFLFWGPENICFYNDTFRQLIADSDRHPAMLGAKGEEAWGEAWREIGPITQQIAAGGQSTWYENQQIHIPRNGRIEEVYWTYSHSPVIDETGATTGVLVTCIDTTTTVTAVQKLTQAHERLDNIFTQVGAGIAQADVTGRYSAVNDQYCQLLGYTREELLQRTFSEVTHPDDVAYCEALVKQCIEHGKDFNVSKRYVHKDGTPVWVSSSVSLIIDDAGNRSIVAVSLDDTAGKKQEMKLAESEVWFRTLAEQAPIFVFLASPDGTVEYWNPQWLEFVGQTFDEAIGKDGWPQVIHPEDLKELSDIYYAAIAAREKYTVETRIRCYNGQYRNLLFNGEPRYTTDGTFNGYIGSGIDITPQVESRRAIEASEVKFRSLIEHAPVATCLFVGRELIIEVANDIMIGYWGKDRSVIGKPLAEGVPELIGQSFLEILDTIFATGQPFHSHDAPAQLKVNGILDTYYFDFTYQPLFDAAGNVYAVMDMATDVTAQVVARKKLEETELKLREAVELAELATWHINVAEKHVIYSDRLRDWIGISEKVLQTENSPIVHERDRDRVMAALRNALDPTGPGVFNEVYSIKHLRTGQEHIIHSTGRTVFDNGKAVSISGTAQNVTVQVKMQLALENEVQTRTLELAEANEKLQKTNNDLAEVNKQLLRSNEELAQYAYVASHDLQEPLRKIQVFTDMLRRQTAADRIANSLAGKIEKSALRMSLLIKDLLTFSRLLHSETLLQPVNLNDIIEQVWNDFELVMLEKDARISVAPLPEIEGIRLQMNQLFYNLIGNALKFVKHDVPPEIDISASQLSSEETLRFIKAPDPSALYYRITIRDNGIGFDQSHSEQIFEVFKRLHGREIYPGSGIGLALCRRIVNNHNGHLYATSAMGAGTTINIILPHKQPL